MSGYKDRSRRIARELFWEENDRKSYVCPDCGRTEDEINGKFEVHHKNGEPMDNRPENHVGLCRLCHNLREEKKPSIESIKTLRNSSTQSEKPPRENTDKTDKPDLLMRPRNYTGDWGRLICPCSGQKLGNVEGPSSIIIKERPCCDLLVIHENFPCIAVFDDGGAHTGQPTREEIKIWMIRQWSGWLKNKSVLMAQMPRIAGYTDDGEMKTEYEVCEHNRSDMLLTDIIETSKEWGWDHVEYAAKIAKDSPKPSKAFEADLKANRVLK
jgi:hypothetical protein